MKYISILALAIGAIFMSSCGGGGGGGQGGEELSNNACSTLGLNTKIINGTECDAGRSPVVQINLITSNGRGLLCSGTMVTSQEVLTAAHCFPPEVESAYIEIDGRQIPGTQVAVHPQYRPTNEALFNDVAVLRLQSTVDLPTVPVLTSRTMVVGDIIAIFGYGKTENESSSNPTAGTLRSGEMRIDQVTPDHLFANFRNEGSNTCQGDSGGPALFVINGQVAIVGITSTGSVVGCGNGDISLFANVQTQSYLNFIKSVLPNLATL